MKKYPLMWGWGTAIALLLSSCDATPWLSRLPKLPPVVFPSLPSSQPYPVAPTQSVSTAQMEATTRQQINQIRQKHGLTPLQNNEKLAQVARNYSKRMAQQKFFSHTSPSGDTMTQRIQAAGIFYFMIGENLFMGTYLPQPVQFAVDGWMQSPGHRANILRPEYRETGIGVWRQGDTYYFTQLFLRGLR